MTRIYQPISLAIQQKIRLDDQAAHHLVRVLRAKIGDDLILFNGQGGEYSAVISHIDKKKVEVDVLDFIPREVESPVRIHLAQGVARGEKMDFVVQKAVELGVAHITPLISERCNVRLDSEREEKRLQHWRAITISACEQSGRNRLPPISPMIAFKDWVSTVQADLKFVLSPHVENKLPINQLPANATVLLLIGPEGGLSEEEVSSAIQRGFLPLNLGPRVLRTETATIAAITALQLRYGDFA